MNIKGSRRKAFLATAFVILPFALFCVWFELRASWKDEADNPDAKSLIGGRYRLKKEISLSPDGFNGSRPFDADKAASVRSSRVFVFPAGKEFSLVGIKSMNTFNVTGYDYQCKFDDAEMNCNVLTHRPRIVIPYVLFRMGFKDEFVERINEPTK